MTAPRRPPLGRLGGREVEMAGHVPPGGPDEGPTGRSAFRATLVRWPGAGGWVFAPVPDAHAPGAAGPFGRVPVTATVDGRTWSTSVWRDRAAGWLLAVGGGGAGRPGRGGVGSPARGGAHHRVCVGGWGGP
ncbi:DUF1905 domain-containing protein, partial [Micromonospora purpureochromogenes]|uniref:DUF1905 domain-containing protein n=1 Tax=Micromonospora purpureochromogenes TaxID=47872 RepID=UPI00332B0C6E